MTGEELYGMKVGPWGLHELLLQQQHSGNGPVVSAAATSTSASGVEV